jgi:predicted alpha/beta-hydrolase family hydrolase
LSEQSTEPVEIDTPVGPARVQLAPAEGDRARGLVALGHGAGGGVNARDLVAVTAALAAGGWSVARVEQPYRVRGRRFPDRAPLLDEAWVSVVAAIRDRHPGPLVLGGRSSGGRVACRTATTLGAAAVVCLAFPLRPPPRRPSQPPGPSRAAELAMVTVPLLVVQGERDPFGGPADFPPGPLVVAVPGDHALRRTADVAAAVVRWLDDQGLDDQRLA